MPFDFEGFSEEARKAAAPKAVAQEPEEKSISFGDFVSALSADSIARSAQNLETAQMEAPIGETIIDTAGEVAQGIAGLPDAWSRIMAAENGITAAFTDENIREANESGDYSTLDTAAETLREEGGAAGNALLEPAYALTRPTRERLGSAINTWADEGSDLAAGIRNTATYVDYMMSDEAKLQKAREIETNTGISAEAILNDSDAYKQALKIDDFTRKQKELMSGDFSMEAVFDEYPELKDIAKMSPGDAALALHNIDSVRSTHSVIETFTHFLEAGNKKLEYDNLQYKIMMGTADENDRLRAANLHKEIEKEQKEAPSFWDDPAAAMAAALAQSTPEMWQSITEGARDASILASAAMIAGAAAGSAVPVLGTGVGAAAGGFAGFVAGFGRSMLTQAARRQAVKAAVGAGFRVGMVQGMAKPESGSRFAEYKELKDENGKPLLTDEEARGWALLGGYANAGIEMANFGAVTKAFGGVPHAGKIFDDIISRAGAELTAKEAIKNIARDRVIDTLKVTGSESGEEMLQSISDDLIHNSMLASKNVTNGQYSAGEILTRGAASFVESLPGSLAFGLIGAGGGTFTSGLKARAALKNKAAVDAKFGADAKKTINGTLMLEQLQQAVAEGKMKETAPDVQQKILRNQLSGTGFETAYIDVEMALKKENGREDLKKVADAAGISEDKLNVAIEEGGFLSVPVEQYSQSAASPELLQSVSFDADADSIARMKESARVTTEAVQKAQEAAIDRQLRLMDNIVNEYYPEGQADKDVRDAVLSSIYTNPQNPKLGWQNLNASIRKELDDILAPAMAALKAGMGQGVDILNFEDDLGNKTKYTKASNNAPWYSNFYKLHHRAPNAAELEEMAIDLTIGAPTAPKVEGWIPDSEEAVASMKETEEQIRSLQAQLKTMGKIKDQMGKMTGAEMQLTEGLSKEAFHIYRELTELLMTAKGASARAARMGAILYARHADIYAEAATRATGSKYTAADYAKGVRVQIGKDGKPQEVARAAAQMGSTLNELLPSVDIDEEVDVLNLDKITDELKGKSLADVKAYIQNLSETKPIPTADFFAMVGMPERADSLGRTHIVRGTSQRGSNITVRNKMLLNLETIIRNSRVIEITANTKQKPLTGLNGRKRKAQGRKNKVKRYFRIMTPVQFNNRPATLAITAEDFGSGVTLDRENVSLYEIKLHKKRDPLPAPPLGTRMSESPSTPTVPEKNKLVKVTIREMLTGIPDAEGKPFINEDGTANVFSFDQMAGEGSLTADHAALAEAQKMAEGGAKEQVSQEASESNLARWFGESKIVNLDGTPKVVYHGTATDALEVFDKKKAQDKMGRQLGLGWGKGKFYFTEYEVGALGAAMGAQGRGQRGKPRTIPVYLKVEKPITLTEYERRYKELSGGHDLSGEIYTDGYASKDRDKLIARLDKAVQKEGYDGIVDQDSGAIAVFDNRQIKAVDNYGEFNPSDPNIYHQGPQGTIQLLSDGSRVISLFETADESTFVHELGHLFLMDLANLAQIDKTSAKELEIVNSWAAWYEGAAKEYSNTPWAREFKAREREILAAEREGRLEDAARLKEVWRQERFARAFELYLRDGHAPAKGLKAVFRKFKSFLRQIYAAFSGDGGKASMEVRRVMDRLIATEDEIEEASLDDRFSDVTKAGGEKLFNETEEETYKRWLAESEEEAKEKLTAILMKDLTEKAQREYNERITREKARIRQELENENCYLAEAAVKATGDKNIVTEFGFESFEEYETFMTGAGPLEENLQILIEEYEKNLDQELINARVTEEQINEAMQTPEARAKLDELTSAALAKKRGLANRITSKTERAIQDVEDKITALPEDVDLKMNHDSAPVKRLMKALRRLDVAARWKSKDFARIQKMVEAATKEELTEALKDFKAKAREDKANEAAVEKANQGRLKLYRERAAAMIQRKTIGEISPYTFEREARTAARRVKTAIRAKNWDLAISMQQQQALMQAMYHEAIKARQEVDKLVGRVKKQMGAKTVRLPKEERYWHRHLAYLLRIAKRDVEQPEGGVPDLTQMFKDAADAHEAEDTPKIIADISAQGENFGGYQTLTMDELREAVDALTMLYTTGKDKFNLKSIGGRSIADVVGEIMGEAGAEAQNMLTTRHTVEKDEGGLFYSDLLAKLPGTLGGESIGRIIAKKGQEYVAGIIKPEEILRALGPTAHRYIYGLYERATDKEGKMLADATEGLRQILSTYTDKEKREWKKRKYKLKLNGTKIFASEEMLSKENIICMALNMGNNTNWQRLVGGFEQMPTKEHPNKAAALRGFIEENMDKRDWELVQAIWDHIGQYWKETVKVEETLTGVTPKGVQPDAFTVKTPDGEEINLRGGYYPIAYAPDKSAKAAEQEQNKEARGVMSGASVLGYGMGSTKERSEANVVNRPLLLEFSVVPKHVQEVVHIISYRVAARDVYRLVNNRDFEEHVSATLGTEYHRILKEWATDTWSIMDPGANRAQGMLNRVFSSLRRNSVMAIMGYRLWPAVENLSNLAIVMDKLGASKTLLAMSDFYSHMGSSKEFLYKSTFMRNRLNNMDRDIRSQTGLFEADIKPIAFMKEHAYDLMLYSDLMISAPTWVQAYKDAYLPKLREVREENEANIKKIQETQEALDKAKAQITDLQKNSTDIENYLTTRSYGTPEEVEAYRDSPFLKRSFDDLRAESAEHRRAAGEVKKGLWKLEEEHNKALQLPLYTDTEILDEAETRAIEAADAVIRDTFGSGRTQDLASIQRARGELYKFMTTFSSFFNTQFNAILAKYRQAKYGGMESTGGWSHFEKWWPFYRAITYRLVMTSLIGSALKFALGLDGDDDKKRKYIDPETGEEKEEDVSSLERFLKVFGKNVLSMSTGALIGVRELATVAINYIFDGTSYSSGVNPVSVGYRSLGELGTTVDLIARKSEKDLEIEAREAKRRKKQQDALKKKHGKARQEYLKKIEEDEKYRKPPKRITYSEIARHGLGGIASLTAANTGVTSTVVDAVTGTMQYLNDTDNRYDADWRNIVWSALFDKKPVEREIPERPPQEEKGEKKKKKTASE